MPTRYQFSWQNGLLAVLLLALFLTPIRNFDIWWHLQAGVWMLAEGRFLDQDLNSFTLHGAHWHNFAWLFQVSLALFYHWFGEWGLLLLKGIVWLAILILLLNSVGKQNRILVVWGGLLLLFAAYLFPYMHLRPHLYGLLCLAIAVGILFRREAVIADTWLYAAVIFLWANTHASVIVGAPALLLHYVFGGQWRFVWDQATKHKLLLAIPLGLLIFATPNGTHILDVVFTHATGNHMYVYIAEWMHKETPLLLFLGLAVVLFGLVLQRIWITPAELVLLLFFTWMSLDSMRFHMELGFLLLRPLGLFLDGLLATKPRELVLLMAALLLMSITVYRPLIASDLYTWRDYPVLNKQYPQSTVEVLRHIGQQQGVLKVWNDYAYGGYLAWQGAGKLHVYIDGRTPTLYPENLLLNAVLAANNFAILSEILAHYAVDAILLRRQHKPLVPMDDETWWLVAFDRASVLYLRNTLAQKAGLVRMDFSPSTYAAIDDEDISRQRADQLRRLLKFDESNVLAWTQLGLVLGFGPEGFAQQHMAEAVYSLGRAVELNPNYAPASIRLAVLLQKSGADAQAMAEVLLPLVGTRKMDKLAGKETQLATLLLDLGYGQHALQVLIPEDIARRRWLDKQFDAWLLRAMAYDLIGQTEQAKEAAEVAGLFAQAGNKEEKQRYSDVVAALSLGTK